MSSYKLKGIDSLAEKMVGIKKDTVYLFVYKLVKFTFIIHVATTGVKRVFSTKYHEC